MDVLRLGLIFRIFKDSNH